MITILVLALLALALGFQAAGVVRLRRDRRVLAARRVVLSGRRRRRRSAPPNSVPPAASETVEVASA